MNIKIFPTNFFSMNTYLIWDDTHEAAIIDAGFYSIAEQNEFKRFVNEHELHPTLLLNTHLHLDHVFGNPFMLREYGLSTHAHQADEFLLQGLEQQCRMFGFQPNESPVPIGCYINEGQTFTFGQTTLTTLHIPGHSPGSIVFYNEASNVAFVGDVLFQGSIGRTDLEGGDFNQLINGIQHKLLSLPDETIIYSGHGMPTTIGDEKQSNPYIVSLIANNH